MPRPTITAVNILEKRREDGGADLLVQVTLGNGDVHWLAVRQGDATLTATRAVEGHGRRFVTVPARRTLKAGVANLLTDWPEILRQNRVDAKGDHWELYRDDFDRRERRRRLDREWRVHELNRVQFGNRSSAPVIRGTVWQTQSLALGGQNHGFQTGRGLAATGRRRPVDQPTPPERQDVAESDQLFGDRHVRFLTIKLPNMQKCSGYSE
jgi:hypothetical protein